jgi:hypothetical protein
MRANWVSDHALKAATFGALTFCRAAWRWSGTRPEISRSTS